MPTHPADRAHLSPLPRPSEREAFQPPSLPRPLTSFIGRAREVAAVATLLRRNDVRLVTLTGPGGIGKTRLAIRAAEEVAGAFPDGVWFVPLAPIRDPALVLPTIALTLNAQEEHLAGALRRQQMLLVLDNLEQVLAAAPQLAELLVACPALKILVTSRTILRISGEHHLPVPPLSLSEEKGDRSAGSSLPTPHSEAVQLFGERAVAIRPDFALNETTTIETVSDICRRLDGLPLAIELAAAWVEVLSPKALLARLDHRLALLTGGAIEQPKRLQTMRDAIAWSHDLLEEAEQTLFRRLAVFVGGFTLDAADAVASEQSAETSEERCSAHPSCSSPSSVLDGVRSLVHKSLLKQTDGPGADPRYLMLETVREYGLEQLTTSDDGEKVRRRHASYFAAFAEQFDGPSLAGPDPALLLARMDAEQDNVRAALTWADECGEVDLLLRLAAALDPSWALGGRLSEGRTWMDRALAAGDGAPAALRAVVLRSAAWFAQDQSDAEAVRQLADASLAQYRDLDDTPGLAQTLLLRSQVARDHGDYEQGQALVDEALAILAPLDEPYWTAAALQYQGWFSYLRGDLAAAERQLEEALALCRREDNRMVAAETLADLSAVALARGEPKRAAALMQEHLHLTWDSRSLPWAIKEMASIAQACGKHECAARLLGATDAQRRRLGMTVAPEPRPDYEADVATTRAALGEARFAALWAEGQALSPEHARAEATRVADLIARPARPTPAAADPLAKLGITPREREVLALLVDGHSAREIAETLYISPKTVDTHIHSIKSKLGVPSRAAAVAYAHRHGLV